MDEISDDTKAGFQRVELLTGPVRRRRWSAEEKARIVGETLLPGARVSEVARRWQLHPQQLFGWRRDARVEAGAGYQAVAGGMPPSFAPIVVSADVGVPTGRLEAMRSSIEVELAGAVVRVAAGVDDDLLTAVLRAVRCSSSRAT
jgi:transposase